MLHESQPQSFKRKRLNSSNTKAMMVSLFNIVLKKGKKRKGKRKRKGEKSKESEILNFCLDMNGMTLTLV